MDSIRQRLLVLLRCYGACNVCTIPGAESVPGIGIHGYAQGRQRTVHHRGESGTGSVQRTSVCVLQPPEENTEDTLLGHKRILFVAEAVGEADVQVAKDRSGSDAGGATAATVAT